MKNKLIFLLMGMLLLGVFFMGSVSAGAYWTSGLDSGLMRYYKLDETSGTVVIDSTNTQNGTNYGGIQNQVTGILGKAYNFTGAVSINITGLTSTTKDYSFQFWANPNTFQNVNRIVFQSQTGLLALGIDWWGGVGQIGLYNGTESWFGVSSTPNVLKHYIFVMNTTGAFLYVNGIKTGNTISRANPDLGGKVVIGASITNGDGFKGTLDEIGIWNRSLTQAEITDLYNGGSGLSYGGVEPPSISVNLTSPANNSIISTSTQSFLVNLTMSGANYSYRWTNNTINVWFSNGTLFKTNFTNGLSGNNTNISTNISGFTIGNYLWNSYACYGNTTASNCTWAISNNTFTMGSSVNSITYSNNAYETSLEQFIINFTLAEGAQLSLAKLNYNGTNYTISNITNVGNNYILERTINIPLNVNPLANQTNTFYVSFTYNGGSVQISSSYTQNSSFINLVKCGAPYLTQALNFTFYDEYSLTNINSATNKTTIFSSFKYWLGGGSVYKNYSFQNLSSTLGDYQFCIYPYASNITFRANMDMGFYADTYREGTYYLRNASLTNISSDVLLYLIPTDYATKFFLTFNNGVDTVSMATVNVQEYFVGLGMYKTVTILLTDAVGQATMWQEVDKNYRYSIVQNNQLLGIVDRVSICSATPCALTIMISQPIGSAFSSYDNYFAQNVLSSITYDKTTHIVTYTFIDTTGLANYFRFEVTQSKVDGTGATICNTLSYSSAGTLTCNLTNLTGDFLANGYISRSPEKVDKFLSFVIDADVLANLGTIGIFLVMILIITIVIGGVVISKGNPTTVLFLLGMAILGTKLIGLLFFSWAIVVALEVLIFWMIFQIKS